MPWFLSVIVAMVWAFRAVLHIVYGEIGPLDLVMASLAACVAGVFSGALAFGVASLCGSLFRTERSSKGLCTLVALEPGIYVQVLLHSSGSATCFYRVQDPEGNISLQHHNADADHLALRQTPPGSETGIAETFSWDFVDKIAYLFGVPSNSGPTLSLVVPEGGVRHSVIAASDTVAATAAMLAAPTAVAVVAATD